MASLSFKIFEPLMMLFSEYRWTNFLRKWWKMLISEMNGHGHDFGPDIFKDFRDGLGHGLGQSHDFGHRYDIGHGHDRKSRTRTNFGHACPLISG